jgi:hypothetical protein
MRQLLTGLKAWSDEITEHNERLAAARQAWWAGGEPVPAEVPRWPEDSLGDRFLDKTYLEEARNAPGLLTADVPDAAVIAADSAHWNVAAGVLARAVVFDGLRVDHPAVSALLDVLAPVAEAELAYGEVIESPLQRGWSENRRDNGFPELDGPVFLIGGSALVDATWALVGNDALSDVLPVLRSAVGEAVPGLDAGAVADALMGAFAQHYRCEQPGDTEILERIGNEVPGDALEHLVATGVLSPGDVLRVGLTLLSALARLCMSGSVSIQNVSSERGAA